jgi:hypothetical protein
MTVKELTTLKDNIYSNSFSCWACFLYSSILVISLISLTPLLKIIKVVILYIYHYGFAGTEILARTKMYCSYGFDDAFFAGAINIGHSGQAFKWKRTIDYI